MNYLLFFLIFISIFFRISGVLFDRFTGKTVDDVRAKELKLKNIIENCTLEVKACTPYEGSRINGTCNNYKYPSKGAARGPYLRLLNPDYDNGTDIRRSTSGNALPSARRVRTVLQSTGRVVDKSVFNVAAAQFLEFIHQDISALNGPSDFLTKRQYCCQPEGEKDPRCIPIRVPDDDPYLKLTDIRCLNFSRAETFQDTGCITEIISPEQINFQTPLLDLSTIYGVDENALSKVREWKDGLILERNINPDILPVTVVMEQQNTDKLENRSNEVNNFMNGTVMNNNITNVVNTTEIINTTDILNANISNTTRLSSIDMLEQKVNQNNTEAICYKDSANATKCNVFDSPEKFKEVGNINLRTTIFSIFFLREHNRIARALHKINPCWKDDRLFKVARQINIATAANIFMYELLPALLGHRNMVNYGLISEHVEYLTAYDNDAVPLVFAEYEIATRFYHTFMDGRIKKYDERYRYSGDLLFSDTLYRKDLIENIQNLKEINRGIFYQHAAKIDDIQDPEISENYYGKIQRAHDLAAMDIQRGRDLGIRSYNDYRDVCGLKKVNKFEDFSDLMEPEKVESLKRLYENVDDVDLLAGIMAENFIQGTYAGPTLFCIMAKQLMLFRFADRFWYERGDQLHSFKLPQLNEIKKTNIARLACDNAEGIEMVQPRAMFNVAHGNTPVHCSNIEGPDLTKWYDSSCNKNKHHTSYPHQYSFESQKLLNRNQPYSYQEKYSFQENKPMDKHMSPNPLNRFSFISHKPVEHQSPPDPEKYIFGTPAAIEFSNFFNSLITSKTKGPLKTGTWQFQEDIRN